ncbi:MAG: hypothetical protein HY331_05640 [Chloroflexi bacterium]|nr:hypothetical protein [Chloroflexota bacterium]
MVCSFCSAVRPQTARLLGRWVCPLCLRDFYRFWDIAEIQTARAETAATVRFSSGETEVWPRQEWQSRFAAMDRYETENATRVLRI